jgi:hypothetical protein
VLVEIIKTLLDADSSAKSKVLAVALQLYVFW